MKQVLVFILLVTIVFSYNGLYPRSKQSCQDKHVIGLFWDGQKCDLCANEYCYCSDYLGCDKCQEGYSLYKFDHADAITKCYSCNYDSGSENVKECCFHGVTNQYDYDLQKQLAIKEKMITTNEDQYLITRAVSCKVQGQTEEKEYNSIEEYIKRGLGTIGIGQLRRYGSYCLKYTGCVSYNNYGQCFECAQGYYLNHHNDSLDVCVECPANCKTCGVEGQCNECNPGHYLNTQVSRVVIDQKAKTQSFSSVCEKCQDNCLCDGKIVQKENQVDRVQLCNLGCINDSFVLKKAEDEGQDTCIQCDKECKTCRLGTEEEGKSTVCLSCHTTFQVNDSFYAEINSKNTCLKCPSNCHQCRLLNDTTTTCIQDKCNNGFYQSTSTTTKRTTCKPCNQGSDTNQYALRCEKPKLITQCQHLGTNQKITYQDLSQSIGSIGRNIVHLVGEGENSRCVINENNCKKISATQTNNKDDCETCYEDKNYFINKLQNKTSCKITSKKGCLEIDPSTTKCKLCRNQVDRLKDKEFNYFLKDGDCVECPKGCLECDSNNVCLSKKCQSNYYQPQGSLVCTLCSLTNCDECNSQKCTSCAPGYTLFNKVADPSDVKDQQCVHCSQNCLECNFEKSGSDRRICTECADDFYLSQGTCYKKRTNCARQKDNGQCEYCVYGYRVVNGYCLHAIDTRAGYINIEYSCGTNHRVRDDGFLLNREEFSDVYQPLGSNIVSFGFVMLAIVSLFL